MAAAFLLSVVPPSFASTTTFTVPCTMANSAPQATLTVSISGGTGTSVSPTSAACTGSAITITVTYTSLSGASTTVAEPAPVSNTFYEFSTGVTSVTQSCSGSTCPSYTLSNYLLDTNTPTLNPVSPASWDQAYSEPVTGEVLGTYGTVCSVSLVSSGGAAGCSASTDYNTLVYFPDSWTSQTPGSPWVLTYTQANSQTYKPTTGGNTENAYYSTQASVGESITTVGAGSEWYQGVTEIVGALNGQAKDWYTGLTESLSLLSGGTTHSASLNEVIFEVCGNHTLTAL